jgi:SAM-dependent methyltransferase
MSRGPDAGIRFLDRTVDYADGAEGRLLEILASVSDLSSLSDELAARIDDWPTRYHLARERSSLLRPLSIDGRHRVLEIGAGCGAIARYLGETGARVVALEGSPARARAAAARCRDLDTVEIVCGALSSFTDDDGFDLVLLIGVLEYAGTGDDPVDPATFLARAAEQLRPGGSLVVAIENQLGLKYLLGQDEDHLGRPWSGIEGYPEGGVRTHSRRRLAALLEGCGLDHQRWLYPFPDYKTPTVVIPDHAYLEPDAPAFIDHLVGEPVARDGAPGPLCDHRLAHRTVLEAGLGRELASSFLVLASAGPPAHGAEPDPATLAWLFGGSRRRRFIRHQVVEGGVTGRRIRAVGPGRLDEPRREAWLVQRPAKDEVFIVGETIHDLAVAAARRRDAGALASALAPWCRFVDRARRPAEAVATRHPYLDGTAREVLPADHLDLNPANFVVTGDDLAFVDREWLAEPVVDADLVAVRGLWLLARKLVGDGGIHPWDPALGVDEVTVELGTLTELPAAALLDRLYPAEAELLALVTGRDREAIEGDLGWLRSQRPTDPEVLRTLPLARLEDRLKAAANDLALERRERARLETEVAHERSTAARLAGELSATHLRLAAIGANLEEVATALGETNRERDELRTLVHEREVERQRTEAEADDARRRLAELEAEAAVLRGWRAAFEGRWPVRLWRRLQRIVG